MPNYEKPVLTNKGLEILTRINSGNNENKLPLKLTKMAIGSGMLPSGQKPEEMTDLIKKIKDISIIDFRVTGLGLSDVTGEINNVGVSNETAIYEIGVYAEDSTTQKDILYTYVYTRNSPIILYQPVSTLYFGEFTVKTIISRDGETVANVLKPEKAQNIEYDNGMTGLSAKTVQEALDEMLLLHPLNHIFQHNKNTYPDILAIEFDYGYGVGGYGSVVYGGRNGKKIRNSVEYLDLNQLRVLVEKDYGTVKSIGMNSSTEYIVTFTNSTISLCILLIENGTRETSENGAKGE